MAEVALKDLVFSYKNGKPILNIPELQIERGEHIFLFGPSGSGKTTLLGLLGGILVSRSGSVRVLGHELSTMSASKRDRLRGEHMGYIFQNFNLISYLTVAENIALPAKIHPRRGVSLARAVREATVRLDIAELVDEKVQNLSVGQQQRVAAARALLGEPRLVIADEPTSSLDSERREGFLELIFENCRRIGSTLIFVSHDKSLMPMFHRTISLAEINRAGS